MIEIQLDLQEVDIIRMENFPEGSAHEEDIYDELVSLLQSFEVPTSYRRYLVAVGYYLSDNFESESWRVLAYVRGREVGRMEYSVPMGESKPVVPTRRVSRYARKPVI